MRLIVLREVFAICQVSTLDAIDWRRKYVFTAKTEVELSVVCEQSLIPNAAKRVERGWRALRVQGTLAFGEVGILAGLTGALAKKGISIFAVSTYNTDYLLIKEETLDQAIRCLRDAGYHVE